MHDQAAVGVFHGIEHAQKELEAAANSERALAAVEVDRDAVDRLEREPGARPESRTPPSIRRAMPG